MPLLRLPRLLPSLRPTSSLSRPARSNFARPLSTSPVLRLKEDADRSPDDIESKKQEQLKKQDKGEGEWHESLGSQSESHVKADREEVQDHGEHMEDLQEETKKAGEKGEI